jgi:hypothetical protein
MSNPYLAILATPPGRERFGFVVPALLAATGATVAAAMNKFYEVEDVGLDEADSMIKDGQVPKPFATAGLQGQRFSPSIFSLAQRHMSAPRSVADGSMKLAYLLGALSRYTLDRRFADKGARLLSDFRKSPMSADAQMKERTPAKISELYAETLREVEPLLGDRKSDPGVKYLLGLMGRQSSDDTIRSAQKTEEDHKARALELFDPTANQDACFPEGREAREAHTKLFAKIPSFLQEPDPKASPAGCKNRLKPWVAPTGIGVGVGLVALLLFRRRRPQQTVVMIPSSSSSPVPTPTPANR